MNEITTLSTLLVGVVLRLGLPVTLTVLGIIGLRRLDAHWQATAGPEMVGRRLAARNAGCWKHHNCTPENRAKCPAFQNQDSPCWQVFRDENGLMQERCLGCEMFRNAPLPVAT